MNNNTHKSKLLSHPPMIRPIKSYKLNPVKALLLVPLSCVCLKVTKGLCDRGMTGFCSQLPAFHNANRVTEQGGKKGCTNDQCLHLGGLLS